MTTRRIAAGVLSAVTAAVLAYGSPAVAARNHLVLGYYVPYDATSWASLQTHADQIDVVAPQWVTVDACGSLGSTDDRTLNRFAQAHGIGVVPSLLTLSGSLNHRLLTDAEVRQHTLDEIVAYTVGENYAGFDLDLEAVDPVDRAALSSFVGRAASALHEQGKLLTLALPAKDREMTTGWAGAYDYAALGAAADLVTIMAYEYSGSFSGPGSVAPIDWVERVLGFAARQIPPDKLLLGLAFYGYDWNVTSGGARLLGYPEALGLADRHAVDVGFDVRAQSATFSYTGLAGDPTAATRPPLAHDVTIHEPPACDIAGPLAPAPTPTPVAPTVPADTPQVHEVWVEDAGSAATRLALASRSGIRGVASWCLGLEDERVWPAIAAWRAP